MGQRYYDPIMQHAGRLVSNRKRPATRVWSPRTQKRSPKVSNLKSPKLSPKLSPTPSPVHKVSICQSMRRQNEEAALTGIRTFEVVVGRQRHDVHETLLCHGSEYFKLMLSSAFAEARSGVVQLEDKYERAFNAYVEYLYGDGEAFCDRASSCLDELFQDLAQQVYFADYIQDIAFYNTLIDSFIRLVSMSNVDFPKTLVEEAYTNLPEHSTFIKLLRDFYVYKHPDESLDPATEQNRDIHKAPDKFWRDVCYELFRNDTKVAYLESKYPWQEDPCRYHNHPLGAEECGNSPVLSKSVSQS